jgi:hypothetical protein
VYSREINGQEYSFGVSGKLIRNVLVMYDRQTGTLWSQLLGEAVEGSLLGTKLDFVPSWMMNWEAWQEIHPETLALDKGGQVGGRDVYEGYYRSGSAGVIGETLSDDRLYTKEFVVGVELADASVAYPFSVLNFEPIVNDTVAGTDLLVVFDANSAASAVFNRVVGEQALSFSAGSSPMTITDLETGSTWDAISGEAVDGPLAGESLERVKSTQSFWFGWKDFHPDTEVYGIDNQAQ